MVKVTAAEVNELRKKTGAGMMDCKKALVEAEGNIEKKDKKLLKKEQTVIQVRVLLFQKSTTPTQEVL